MGDHSQTDCSTRPVRSGSIELIVLHHDWNRALRALHENLGQFGVAQARWQSTETGQRLLVTNMQILSTLPTGSDRPPLDDWIVLMVEFAGTAGWSARKLLGRTVPKRSHRVVGVVIYPGDPPRWDAAVYRDGKLTQAVSAIQIVGPGMLRIDRPASDSATDDLISNRWSRTAGAVGPRVMRRIRQSTVNVVGVGRNGCAVSQQLASLGAAHLRLIDGDVLEEHNLDAMPGLSALDVGDKKVHAVGRHLARLRPDLQVTCFDQPITAPEVYRALSRLPADLVISTVDNDTARLATSLLAQDTFTVHLDIGTIILREQMMAGDARLMLPGGQGCVVCVGGLRDLEEARYELAAPPGALKRGRPRTWQELRAGSLVTLNSMTTGCLQLWLDLLGGQLESSFWQRMRWVPGAGLQSHGGPVGAGDDCPYCR